VNIADRSSVERRVLVLAPTRRDAELTFAILRDAGFESLVCADAHALVGAYGQGAGAILLAEEAFSEAGQVIVEALAGQPRWSDLPVLLLTHAGADSSVVRRGIDEVPNLTLLERPLRIATLLSAVRSALASRERQYQIRGHLEALRDADRRKDEFLATLAHELRNPLAPIRNGVDLLRLTPLTDPNVIYIRDVLERQVHQMVRLVDDLMEVSRITRGMVELQRERIDLSSVLVAAIESSQPLIDDSEQQLIVGPAPDRIIVDADPVRLAQVFSNLLNNAAKHSGKGRRIWLDVNRTSDGAVVSVRDDGEGMTSEVLSGIFEMFTQGAASARRGYGGLGIGLALARRLVEMHGGTIEARSEGRGLGSQFVVTLPLAKPDVQEIESDRQQPPERAPVR
jgi:signal transduction histidine kinase